MENELLEKIKNWHDDGEHQNIIDAIKEIPEDQWDYDYVCYLARAYNNTNNAELAIPLFLSVKDEGENDQLWFFRIGYAYFYSGKYDLAAESFEKAIIMDPEDDISKEFLSECSYYINRAENLIRPLFFSKCGFK